MKLMLTLFLLLSISFGSIAQQWNSARIFQEIKKLHVQQSVLYIAAHPDDENTRLLAYLANEKLYRTGYLSLTRGDGGQNLIGDEQGVDLGLIRTQELLAARRIDGAEQFFTTAYDFGFSKTSAETFSVWNKEKILGEVVWIIRKFKPDVIIARFPEDSRAGHGHHAASGILAREAFYAAADPNRFKEHFKFGVSAWQAKRMLWNTFNFGGNNTTNEKQFKIDVGGYNSFLGKSYGEIAAESRSQHKSQGFGVPSQRGTQLEYFTCIAGDSSMNEGLMDGVINNWSRMQQSSTDQHTVLYTNAVKMLETQFSLAHPEKSLPALMELFQLTNSMKDADIRKRLSENIKKIIANCIGLYAEATVSTPYGVAGDSLKINFSVIARLQDSISLKNIFYKKRKFDITTELQKNKNFTVSNTILLAADEKITQPYWLQYPMNKGSFEVKDQHLIGNADGEYETVQFVFEYKEQLLIMEKHLQYKFTDPVKGEIYQPLFIIPNMDVEVQPAVVLQNKKRKNTYEVLVTPKSDFVAPPFFMMADAKLCDTVYTDFIIKDSLFKNKKQFYVLDKHAYAAPACSPTLEYSVQNVQEKLFAKSHLRTIKYDHIPSIAYVQKASVQFIYDNIQTKPKRVGYIVGAGDKVPAAITQLGYTVDLLTKKDMVLGNLKKYDAILTGIRAYNTNEWMNDVYDDLMQYVQNGGNLIVQYNTSNQIGPVKAKIAPYPFTISRNRITEENANVQFINPQEPVLNYPNKITSADFQNWVQERSVYEATAADPAYRKVFQMMDTGEKISDGSLLIGKYGKGNFIYCSLVLFRQLPAGISGAYKLLANMIELAKNK